VQAVPPKQTRPRHAGKFALGWLAVAAFAAVLATDLSARLASAFSPRLGDIARFSPDSPAIGLARVLAHGLKRIGGPKSGHWQSCTLDSAAMATAGGSLIVEAEEPRIDAFWVHWAGGATSTGDGDCGEVADLLVGRRDLMALISAAAGDAVAQVPAGAEAVWS
jgi:hypothetical protein